MTDIHNVIQEHIWLISNLTLTQNMLCVVSFSQNKDGGFLVRDSSKAGKYTVSLLTKGGG